MAESGNWQPFTVNWQGLPVEANGKQKAAFVVGVIA